MKPTWTSDCGSVDLYLGDCLDVLDGIDETFESVVADPPYGMNYQSTWSIGGPRFDVIENDTLPATQWVSRCDFKCSVVFCEWRNSEEFRVALSSGDCPVRSQLVWDRCSHGMGDLKTVFSPRHDLAWWSCRSGYQFPKDRPASVLRFPRVAASKMLHPTQKPVELIEYIVDHVCKKSGTVLDPFMGSGTTGVACANLNRKFVGIEINEEYFNIAKRRIQKALGEDYTDKHGTIHRSLFNQKGMSNE